MRFTKMHGLGNDYVYVNLFEERVADAEALARAVSDRHRGIGSDGLILIAPSQVGDVRMIMYNADGSRGEMCGNGLRCVAKYAYDHGLCTRTTIRVETDVGVRAAQCRIEGGRATAVRAEMGAPVFVPELMPWFGGGREIVDEPLPVNGRELRGTFVSIGSPHWVVLVNDWAEIDLHRDGPAIERHEAFPLRINVHFAHLGSPGEITMLSWERGTGPTQACGSGACAAAAAGWRLGRSRFPTTVHLPGGDLLIECVPGDGELNPLTTHPSPLTLFQTGPAEEIFAGEWPA